MTEPAPAPQLTGPAYLRLVGLGALVGIPAALVAALFLAIVDQAQDWLWTDLPDDLGYSSPPWYLIVGLPAVGALVVFAARTLLPGDGGHEPLKGIDATPTPLAAGPGVALAALATLIFGAVLGPEAPLIALGSVVGMAITRYVRVDGQGDRVLATAGSFSAVSALLGGPLVAGMLMLEASVGLGALAIPVLIPGLVAAGVGYLVFIGFGSWGGLDHTSLVVPHLPAYDGTQFGDLLVALAVGVAAALVLLLVRRVGTRVQGLQGRHIGMAGLLVAGGLVVGLLALLADALGANSQDVLFSGQSSIPAVISEGSFGIVVVLLVAKALCYAICLGCGFRGGPVFPAIFLGVALATLAVIVFGVSPTLAVAVGTAAGMTAMTRLIFSSLLLSAVIVGTAGVEAIPAAVLAASAAWIVTMALDPKPVVAARPS